MLVLASGDALGAACAEPLRTTTAVVRTGTDGGRSGCRCSRSPRPPGSRHSAIRADGSRGWRRARGAIVPVDRAGSTECRTACRWQAAIRRTHSISNAHYVCLRSPDCRMGGCLRGARRSSSCLASSRRISGSLCTVSSSGSASRNSSRAMIRAAIRHRARDDGLGRKPRPPHDRADRSRGFGTSGELARSLRPVPAGNAAHWARPYPTRWCATCSRGWSTWSEPSESQQRGQSTLFPLMALMKAQGSLAGRKALVFFSEGLAIPPNLEEAYRSAISEANRANVSIYAVDARGLDTGRALDQSRQMLDRSGRTSQAQLLFGSSQKPADAGRRDELGASGRRAADRYAERAARARRRDERGAYREYERSRSRAGRPVAADLDSYYEIGYTPGLAPRMADFVRSK